MGDCPKKKEDAKLKTAIMDLQLPFANRQVCQKAIEQDISLKVDSSPNPKIHRPPLRVKKVVIPGARAHRLLSEATVLSRAYNFEHVIVHVGTNYVPFAPEQAVTDITKLLDALPHLFPGCRVTFSPILPRTTPEGKNFPTNEELVKMIREINTTVEHHCESKLYTVITCGAFSAENSDIPLARRNLLAKDGTHLNRKGIVAMDHTLHDYIYTLFGIFRL